MEKTFLQTLIRFEEITHPEIGFTQEIIELLMIIRRPIEGDRFFDELECVDGFSLDAQRMKFQRNIIDIGFYAFMLQRGSSKARLQLIIHVVEVI